MGRLYRVESKIAYMILGMISAFLIAWTPYSVFALIVQFADPALVTPATGVLPALIAKSSICYNPIIYVGLNSQVRSIIFKVFKNSCVGVLLGYSGLLATLMLCKILFHFG